MSKEENFMQYMARHRIYIYRRRDVHSLIDVTRAMVICEDNMPPTTEHGEGHRCSCWLYSEEYLKGENND